MASLTEENAHAGAPDTSVIFPGEFWGACALADKLLAVASGTRTEAKVLNEFLSVRSVKAIMEELAQTESVTVEQVDLIVKLLERIIFNKCGMVVISPSLPGTMNYVFSGLSSHHRKLQTLSVNVIDHVCGETRTNPKQAYTFDERYVQPLIDVLGSENLEAAEAATDVIARAAERAEPPQKRLLVRSLIAFYKTPKDDYGLCEMRGLHCIARAAATDDATFHMCEDIGAIKLFDEAVQTDDILLCMNVLEMLRIMAIQLSGAIYFFQNTTVISELFNMLGVKDTGEDATDRISSFGGVSLLWGPAITFFSAVFWPDLPIKGLDPIAYENREKFVQSYMVVCISILKYGQEMHEEAMVLTTMGSLKEFADGGMQNARTLMERETLVEIITTMTASTNSMYRGTALHILASVFRAALPPMEFGVKLFDDIGKANRNATMSTIDVLLTYARQPLDDTRRGVFDLFGAILSQGGDWGIRLTFSHSKFEEWLMDARSETSMEMKQWKFHIYEALYASSNISLLRPDLKDEILNRVKNGPHHTGGTASAQVATEEAM